MKKIIIAIFIVIATLGIAAGTTTKKTTSKTTTTPKKEVTDPYVVGGFMKMKILIYCHI